MKIFRNILMSGMLIAGVSGLASAEEAVPIIIAPENALGQFRETSIIATPVALHMQDASHDRVGRLKYLGGLDLASSDSRFGGLSSLQVSPDGRRFLALSDSGYWIGGLLDRDGDTITGLRNVVMAPLLDLNGEPLNKISKQRADAEAFAEIPGSGIVVAFEGQHRLWHYGTSATDYMMNVRPRPLPLPLDVVEIMDKLPRNGGIEAMTSLPNGAIVAIAEDGNKGDNLLDGWIIRGGGIHHFKYRITDNFRPTGLAVLPSGDLILLERRFTILDGLSARLGIVALDDLVNGEAVESEHLATMDFPYNVDNMEGISVRQTSNGDTLIYLVSDNNFHPLQRTLLMQFMLD